MILTTAIAARILSPDDYGVMAMAAPILAFILLFQDLGFSAATIQAKQITSEQSAALFWINVGVSFTVASVLLLLSSLVGKFYADARVGYVTAASALPVVLSSLGIQQLALLTRSMQFRTIAMVVICAAIANSAVTIVSAIWLHNYWALFLGTLAASMIQLLMIWLKSDWQPTARPAWADAKPLVRFGSYLVLFDILNFFSRNADTVLIGRVWGAGPVGLYERSQRLMTSPLQLLNAPLARVIVPVLSRLQEEPARFRRSYLFCLRGLLLVISPAATVAVATSASVVLVVLGPQWQAASQIFFWLAIATLYQPIANSTGWLFVSQGRGRAFAVWGIFSSGVAVASFVIGLPGGAASVARAYVIGNLLLTVAVVFWATHGGHVRGSDVMRAAAPFLVGAALTWLLIAIAFQGLPPALLLGLAILTSYAVTVLVLWLWPGEIRFLREFSGLLKSAISRHSFVGTYE